MFKFDSFEVVCITALLLKATVIILVCSNKSPLPSSTVIKRLLKRDFHVSKKSYKNVTKNIIIILKAHLSCTVLILYAGTLLIRVKYCATLS